MKTVAISLGIGAILAGSFSKTFGAASKGVSNLSREIINLKNSQKLLAQYDKDKKILQEKIITIKNTKLAINELKKSMKDEKNQTDTNRKTLASLEKKLASLNKEFSKESANLRETSNRLKEKKISLKDTTKSYAALEKSIKNTELATLRYNKASKAKENASQISGIGTKAIGYGVAGLTLAYKPIQSAIKAEASFADVKKQFDFDTKNKEESFKKELHKIITEKKIAISLEELYGAAASAGQSGLKEDEAIQYIELAAKVGMAFDMSREEAAQSMFEIRNSLNLPYEDLVKLTDQINYLGNTTGASAAKITGFVNRVGSIGKLAGFSDGAIAAIGSTLIEKGMDEERAATGARKIFSSMTKGKAVTKNQANVYKSLGINPVQLAELAQKDAEKAFNLLFNKISKKRKSEQGAILFQLFGEEGKESASKILTDLDRINENLNKMKTKDFEGSVDKEADIKRNTVQNQLETLKGKLSISGSQLGSLLLPEVNKFVDSLSRGLSKLIEFQQANPEGFKKLLKGIVYGSTSLLAFGGSLKVISGGISMYSKYMEIAGFMTEHKFGTKLLSTGKKLVGGIGKVGKVIFKFGIKFLSTSKKLISGIGKVGKAIFKFGTSLLTNPITWYIAAILALVAAGYLIYKNWDKIKGKGEELKNKIIELIDKYWYLMGPIGFIIKGGIEIYKNWDTIKEKAGQLKEKIADMVLRVVENWEHFKAATKESLGAVFTWIEKQWNGVREKGEQVLDFFLNIFKKIREGINDAFATVKSWFTSEPKAPSSRSIPGYARGGIVTRPTLAWIGEGKNSESIIPHESSERSFNLWEKTGRLIGAYDRINNSTNNSTIEFSFSPIIYANDRHGVSEELEKSKQNAFFEFKIMMEKYENEKKRRGYGR